VLQLFPILVVAVVLVADRAPAAAETGTTTTPWMAAAVALGPVLAILAAAAGGLWWCRRRLDRGGSGRVIVLADRITQAARMLLLLTHAAAVLGAGWLDAIRSVTGNLVLVDDAIAVLPPVAGAVGLWWLHYPIERRLREALLLRRLDLGQPVYQFPTRGRYVVQQLRLHILLLLVPLLTILTVVEAIRLGFDQLPAGAVPAWTVDVVSLGAGLLVFVFAPLLARLVLTVEPLEAGAIHDDLEEMCRRHGVRVRRFLLWRTDGSMINAAVMGLVPPLRYVMMTDALVQTMSREQVRAVMAHELGHVRRHHMPWLVASLFALLLLASVLVSLPLLAMDRLGVRWDETHVVWLDGAATAGAAILALIAFGWVSRRYERQADTFAVQHLSGLGAEETPSAPRPVITAEAILAMHGALDAVARLNSVDPQRRSWRHGSIAWRQAYLASTVGLAVDGLPIDRLIRRVKLTAVATLVASGAFTVGLEWLAARAETPEAEHVMVERS
jgi:Zn-dependent protease with chaperone function